MHAVEAALRDRAGLPMRFGPTTAHPVDRARTDENLRMIHAELDAPAQSWLARMLARLGVPDTTVPLVTATPALRRSWFLAVLVAILFALSASSNDGGDIDRITVFLTLAPLVPLAGVALAFGRGVDPTHDLVLAAPRDTFRVFLVRALTVLIAGSAVLLLASLLLPTGGAFRFAWLLPSVAVSGATMAVSSRFEPRRAALPVAAGWIVLVLVGTQAASAQAFFGPALQLAAATVAVGSAITIWRQRAGLEFGSGGRP